MLTLICSYGMTRYIVQDSLLERVLHYIPGHKRYLLMTGHVRTMGGDQNCFCAMKHHLGLGRISLQAGTGIHAPMVRTLER